LSAIHLYFDEDATQHGLIAALRLRGVDVVSALECGLVAAPDEIQLQWCHSQSRAIYTFNVGDFISLHADYVKAGHAHSGIILAPQQRYTIGGQMRRLLKLLATWTAEDIRWQTIFLSNIKLESTDRD